MKRVFAVAMTAVIILLSCAEENSRKIVFDAEKMFHQAEQTYQKATIKPELITKATLEPVMRKYREVLRYCWENIDSLPKEKYPEDRNNLESIAYVSSSKLSRIYTSQGMYDSSITILQELLSNTGLTGKSLLNARADLAGSLQMSGDWIGALGMYRSLLDTFYPPVDNNGDIIYKVLNLPLRLIKTNELLDYPEEAEKEMASAEKYYQRLISEWPNSELANSSRSNLAALLADQQRWDDAINVLSSITDSAGQLDLWAAVRMAEVQTEGKKQPGHAVAIYDDLIARETDSTKLAGLYTRLGKTYFTMNRFAECRETMTHIKNNFKQYYMQDPAPQKYIAMSLEREGNWDRAENEFLWLITNFSQTEEAFTAYLDIVEHFEKEGNNRMKETWLNRAEEFYNEMASRNAGTSIEASALSFKAEVAKRRGDWKKAAELLEVLYRKFPSTDVGRRALSRAAAVYREKLDNIPRADSLLKLLMPDI